MSSIKQQQQQQRRLHQRYNPHDISLSRSSAVSKKLQKISNSIRKKYLAMKLGETEASEEIDRLLKPVTSSLKDIEKNTRNRSEAIDKQASSSPSITGGVRNIVAPSAPSTHPTPGPSSSSLSSAFPRDDLFLKDGEIFERKSQGDDDVFSADSTIHGDVEDEKEYNLSKRLKSLDVYLQQYPDIAQFYVDQYSDKKNSQIDRIFGPKRDRKLDKWTLGNKQMNILPSGDIRLDNEVFRGTEGLYNMLFMKQPTDYNVEDEKNWRKMMLLTNAHKKNFKPNARVLATNSKKYQLHIKGLMHDVSVSEDDDDNDVEYERRRKSSLPAMYGFGYKTLSNNRREEYVYWDDPNELVDRLRLLHASQLAGNNSHQNEILSIEEELRESGIIE